MIRLSHARASFYLAAIAGVAAWVWALYVAPYLALAIGVDVFFAAYLIRTLSAVSQLDAAHMRNSALDRDEPLWVVMLVTLGAAVIAVWLVVELSSKTAHPDLTTTVLTLASLPLAWATIHTMLAWHYAHMYWRKQTARMASDGGDDVPPQESGAPQGFHGGLLFPGGGEPGASDFLYFSFIIGVASQTADVSISSRRIRRVSLVHSLISFVFNTILLASVVNVVVSLA